MPKRRSIVMILFGILLSVASIALFVHDAEYIFTGKTVNLNEILENGGELPRDKYVTYTCEFPLGNYAETQQYYGFIPLPFKTQQYAMLDDSGIVLSAEIKNSNSKIEEMDKAIDEFWDDDAEVSVTLTGCLTITAAGMDEYLEEYMNYLFDDDLESYDIFLTSYQIDTTRTRATQFIVEVLVLAIGVFLIIVQVRK